MTSSEPASRNLSACMRFEAQLGAWMENDLDTVDQNWMIEHSVQCEHCGKLRNDLDTISRAAAVLSPLLPPGNLYSDIERRITSSEAVDMAALTPRHGLSKVAGNSRRTLSVSVRSLAIAATILVAASVSLTWYAVRGGIAGNSDVSRISSARTETGTSLASPTDAQLSRIDRLVLSDAGVTYQQEISALQSLVDQRLAELDSSTVNVLLANLKIIDRAIEDSRLALAGDSGSGTAAAQLEVALQTRLSLMRRIVLL